MPNKIDLTGRRFGRLVVVGEDEVHIEPNGAKTRMWKCQCDCGNTSVVRQPQLRKGGTESCGCLQKEFAAKIHMTHGLSQSNKRLYRVWKLMRRRCNNPKAKDYPRYGGRGISVCKEWNESFASFYEWSMANGYREDIADSGRNRLSIDRINNNGNYEPCNCRWATDDVQSMNTRRTLSDDERYAVCPICGKRFERKQRKGSITCSYECGAKHRSLSHPNTKDYTKICPVCGKSFNAKRGGHFKDAVYCSVKCKDVSLSPVWEYNGESHRAVEWAEIVGINAHCLHHRKEMGWTIEEILTTPFRGKRSANKLQKTICETKEAT